MSLSLRPYQTRIVDEVSANFRAGVRSQIVTAPTGSGKTALAANMLHRAAERGRRSWFVVHRRELILQSAAAFAKEGVDFGIISAGFPNKAGAPIQVCSIQTLIRRLDRIAKPTMIIWDEAHHQAAGSWDMVYSENPQSWHIGLTATPQRLDGRGLDKYFQRIVLGPSVRQLISDGWLSRYRIYAPPGVGQAQFHIRMGEFVRAEIQAAADRPAITGSALAHYQKLVPGRRALIFATSIIHSKHIVDQFSNAGIPAAHLDGDTPSLVRDATLDAFRAGRILVLSNVGLFGEGFDLPGLEAMIDLSPTASLTSWLQRCGRALRPCDGKAEAIILDHASNAMRHGLPDDDDRVWTLAGREEQDEKKLAIRTCPKCFGVCRPNEKVCPYCGNIFEVKSREVDMVDGDLKEIDPEELRRRRKREERDCEDVEALIELGRQRGYRWPEQWARRFHAAREAARAKYRTVTA